MVHGLVGHTSSDCTIANNLRKEKKQNFNCKWDPESRKEYLTYANDVILPALAVTTDSHAQRCRNGGGAVASTKGVVNRLSALGKPCKIMILRK